MDNSTASQRSRILAYLRIRPLDTITARRELNIMHPSARIGELIRAGYTIETVMIDRASDCGNIHRVGMYILREGGAA